MKTSTNQAFIAFDRDRRFRNLTDDSGPSPKSVTIKRNPRSRSNRIVGHVRPEIAVTMVRNTHTLVTWLAIRSRSCSLTEVATHFSRSPSTLSHLVANLEKLSHKDGDTADALRKHLYAIMQA